MGKHCHMVSILRGGLGSLLALQALTSMTPGFAASGVVGTGTPSSCSEDALSAQIGAAPAGGSVTFNCGGNVAIAFTSPIEIAANTTLDGGSLITLSGGGVTRLLSVDSGATLTLKHITLGNGVAGSDCNNSGGAVCVASGGTLTATNVSFTNNYASLAGGAIENDGTTNLSSVSISDNGAFGNGGGIDNNGTVTLNGVVVSYNRADGAVGNNGFPPPEGTYGGGGLFSTGTANLANVLLVGNSTIYGIGGGVWNDGGTLTIRYSTVIDNTSGVPSDYFGDGGGVEGTVTLQATILGGNVGGNCGVYGFIDIMSQGYNISTGGCNLSGTGDSTISSFALPTLGYAGGPNVDGAGQPLLVGSLSSGSQAIDVIPSGTAGCGATVTTDQRDEPRPANGGVSANHCDVGAFEVQPNALPTTGTVTVYTYVDGSEASAVPNNTNFSISLTCGSTTFGPHNVTVASPVVFSGVPAGSCTVSEDTAALPTIAGVGWGAPFYVPSSAIVVYGGLNTNVTVGNTASAQGEVIVSNVVDGPAVQAGLVPSDIDYEVTLTCGSTVLGPQSVPPGGSTTFPNAPQGSCTVSETPPIPIGDFVFATASYSPSATIAVVAAGTERVTVTNTANFLPNSVLVTTTLSGNANDYLGSYTQFTATLKCGSYTMQNVLAPAYAAVFTNVPAGTCTVSETAPTAEFDISWGTPSFSPSATFTTTAGGFAQVAIGNTANFTPNTVAVFINLAGPQVSKVPPSTTFPVTLKCGSTTLSKNITVETPTLFTNVPLGNCSIAQGAAPTVSGVVWGSPTYLPATPTFVVSNGGLNEVLIVDTANSATVSTGAISIGVSVSGSAEGLVPPTANVPVAVSCGSAAPITVDVVIDAAPVVISGLPVGNCAVSQGTQPPIAGVTWGTPPYQPAVAVVPGGTSEVFLQNIAQGDSIFANGFE